jgi:hypothetical protein
MAEALEVEISAFFNKYMETFATWDGDQIAKLYCAPCITMCRSAIGHAPAIPTIRCSRPTTG